jgi:hypothetical protein
VLVLWGPFLLLQLRRGATFWRLAIPTARAQPQVIISTTEGEAAQGEQMQRYLIAAMLVICSSGSVFADEAFYIIYDSMMKGCTIAAAEPTDMKRYKVLGKYKSSSEADKAIASKKEC